jgi:membrane peptidoglycan carboxypeptidase
VAGKTGTTEGENDAWFMGFTNDVTVAVWVGYDNADGKRRTLGGGQTGASVAIPIFEPIIQAVWAQYAPKTPLNPPSAEAKRDLVARTINLASGDVVSGANAKGFVEYFRRDHGGEPYDTQYQLVSREEAYMAHEDETQQGFLPFDPWRAPASAPSQGFNPFQGFFGSPQPQPQPQQRRDAYGQPSQGYPPQGYNPQQGYYANPQPAQPQRRDAYGQPPRSGDPRSGPQPRGNSGFFSDGR